MWWWLIGIKFWSYLFVVVECIVFLKCIIYLVNIGFFFLVCLFVFGEVVKVRIGNFVNFDLKNNMVWFNVLEKIKLNL